ncbi:hypothetical protein [Pyrobaculum neutrophilum]|uniref:Uncharacterized protein n=1 Tax=Pyrobaculum neutrophilum (strain DSM 2338 / JCM 9278 / NBRC 100436 / V24Sta) TaxID=444157 RepID=B1Y8U7_PYRNV|nr:hypothetical protein [Pyrobaculum neutrophilum]ACB40176.1 conserved hypothetical protein [Pyrobaculum neutrophilum V24Sta]
MERYLRKYGDAALIGDLLKLADSHGDSRNRFYEEVVGQLSRVVDMAESYIREESARLSHTLERLIGRVPEFRQLGLGDVEERLAALSRESEVVIEKLRARLEEIRGGKTAYLTLDELFDLIKELDELWDITRRFVQFYSQIYSDLAPLFLITT